MNFKLWLEAKKISEPSDVWGDDDGLEDDETYYSKLANRSEEMFGRRKKNEGMKFNVVLKALGLPSIRTQPKPIGTGSTANVYMHPQDQTKVIKVTGDFQDAQRFEKLRRRKFQHPCIVNCYAVVQVNPTAMAMILDYVPGNVMAYGSMFPQLLLGDNYEDAAEAAQSIMYGGEYDKSRAQVFQASGMPDTEEERERLSHLFDAIAQLERMGIIVADFNENIIDAGDRYVIIDLGQ